MASYDPANPESVRLHSEQFQQIIEDAYDSKYPGQSPLIVLRNAGATAREGKACYKQYTDRVAAQDATTMTAMSDDDRSGTFASVTPAIGQDPTPADLNEAERDNFRTQRDGQEEAARLL